jgi:acyl carrier protein
MTREQIKVTITNIIVSILKHDNFKLKDETTASDIEGWNSLTHMMIINEIEVSFKITFKLKELNKLNCIGDLISLVQIKTEES